MGISIAVWGPPASGKTTVASKLAHLLSNETNSVIYVSLDDKTPVFPSLFPEAQKYTSIGNAIAEPNIAPSHVYKAAVDVGKNFMALGYLAGEGRNAYPAPTPKKAKAFITLVNEMADTVIYDTTNIRDDLMTQAAMRESDLLIKVISPTAESASFLASEKEYLPYRVEDEIVCINLTNDYVRYATDQVAGMMKSKTAAVLPFTSSLRQQRQDGELLTANAGRKFNMVFTPFVRRALAIAGVNFDLAQLKIEKSVIPAEEKGED